MEPNKSTKRKTKSDQNNIPDQENVDFEILEVNRSLQSIELNNIFSPPKKSKTKTKPIHHSKLKPETIKFKETSNCVFSPEKLTFQDNKNFFKEDLTKIYKKYHSGKTRTKNKAEKVRKIFYKEVENIRIKYNISKIFAASSLMPPIEYQTYVENVKGYEAPINEQKLKNQEIVEKVCMENSQPIKGQRRFIQQGQYKGRERRELSKGFLCQFVS